jgi:hypothetical protein
MSKFRSSVATLILAFSLSTATSAATPLGVVITQAQLMQGVARMLFPHGQGFPGHAEIGAGDVQYCGGTRAKGLFLVELKSASDTTYTKIFKDADCRLTASAIVSEHTGGGSSRCPR